MQRFEIINYLTTKFEDCRYLEIGSLHRQNFNLIKAKIKHDVEPYPQYGFKPTFQMTSDHFFQTKYEMFETDGKNFLVKKMYDVIFIDGLHLCEQVIRDVYNSMDILNGNGYIVLHDCYPLEKSWQERKQVTEAWCGDVWKACAWLCQQRFNLVTIKDCPCGCGIIMGKKDFDLPDITDLLKLSWEDFNDKAVNAVTWKEFTG